MPKYQPSIEERKKAFLESCACGASVGGDGFQGSSAPEGPTAGFDPLMSFLKRRKKKKEKQA